MRDFQAPGRSPVMASNGMAATSHPLATNVALKVLQSGGNAVDAAIAASAVLCVVEPQSTGIGGDCFVILHEPDGSIHGLNGSGRAASGAHLDWYLERGIKNLADAPAHCVTVPGALKAWETLLNRFGTRGFDTLFGDAIAYAKDGFPVAPRVAADWASTHAKIAQHAGGQQHLLRGGLAPTAGDVFAFPALARTLETIAKQGASAFYTGEMAQEMAAVVQAEGGFLSEDDLGAITADWVTPITTDYRGTTVHEIPPNGHGITALIQLNLLERLNARDLDPNSVARAHLALETGRLAYSVRDAYVSDPATMQATVKQILSDQHISDLMTRFDPTARNSDLTLPDLPNSDTVYLTVIDKDQRAVSFINSLYMGFGSGIVTKNSGICLQNRGACFSLTPGHPNAIGPRKRPLHTIIPGMATKNGKLSHSFGVMGGAYQPMGHAHVISHMIDYDMDPQQVLDQGRLFWNDSGEVEIETSISRDISTGMRNLGHKVIPAPTALGGGQIIKIDQSRGIMIAGSDPRKDGMAAGY